MLTKLLLCLLTISLFPSSNINFANNEESEEAFIKENFLNPDNYNYLNNKPEVSENGLKIKGDATYKLPFNFQQNSGRKIKIKFNVDEIENRGNVYLIFHNNPENVFSNITTEINGLYMRLSDVEGTSYNLDGYYTDGINHFDEMMAGTVNFKGDIKRDHTFQIETSLVQGYTEGIRMFYNGSTHFGDWLGYSMIKNRTLTNENGYIYFSIVGNVTITNIVSNDIIAPKITYTTPEYPCYAGEEYVFGDIEVNDDIDGNVPYTLKLTNSEGKDITDKLYHNEVNKLCFKPLQTGTYTLRIGSADYSYNASSRRFEIDALNRPHYPKFISNTEFKKEARNNEKYYFPNPEVKDNTEDENEKDNNIELFYSGYFYTDAQARREIKVYEDDKGHYFNPMEYDSVKTDGVGNYFLTIEARNSYGSSFLEGDIWVKYPIIGKDSAKNENIFNKYNWATNQLNNINEDNIELAGSTYYKAGLPIEDGVETNISILDLKDKGLVDTWFSLSFLKHPGNAKYGNTKTGLHLMFFYENDAFRYNAQYVFEDGTHLDIKNNEVLYSDIPSDLSIKIEPFDTSLDPSLYDNITIAFDNQKVDSYEVFKIERSQFSDDENQIYLAYGYHNMHEEGNSFDTSTNPKIKINSIKYSDKIAPEISLLDEFPKNGKVGEDINLPLANAIDDIDGEIGANLLSVRNAKTNRGVTVINNVFVPKEKGTYIVTYSASDSSGNTSLLEKEIKIIGKGGCNGNITSTSIILFTMSSLSIAILLIKKKKEIFR